MCLGNITICAQKRTGPFINRDIKEKKKRTQKFPSCRAKICNSYACLIGKRTNRELRQRSDAISRYKPNQGYKTDSLC